MLYLKGILLTLLFPGTVVIYIPYLVVKLGRFGAPGGGVSRTTGAALFAAGASALLHCVAVFARDGRGTLAPFDPPKRLVVRGLYRFVRNPMYLGIVAALAGEALFFRSVLLLGYAAVWFGMMNVAVLFMEEPMLLDEFGEEFEGYRRSVRRWLPGRPYRLTQTERAK